MQLGEIPKLNRKLLLGKFVSVRLLSNRFATLSHTVIYFLLWESPFSRLLKLGFIIHPLVMAITVVDNFKGISCILNVVFVHR